MTNAVPHKQMSKDRLGAFVHHPLTSLVVVCAILVSVGLVMAHLLLAEDDPYQELIEQIQLGLTGFFFLELGLKYYVAPNKGRFFGQYWIDIIAVFPWAQSLRVLRILRLLRVFRVAIILSRRVRFVAALFRSAVGEYVVLGLIMVILLCVGTFALYVSESRARVRRNQQNVLHASRRVAIMEARLAGETLPSFRESPDPDQIQRLPELAVLRRRIAVIASELHEREPVIGSRDHAMLVELTELEGRLPKAHPPSFGDKSQTDDLGSFENSFWATLYFLVATEPMINVPTTTVGRVVVLLVMFGGLTTFAIFTGVITALMVNRLRRRMEIDDMDRFQLNGHILICGWNRLVPLIIEEVTQSRDQAIVVIADLEEAPEEIHNLKAGARVFFVRGDYTKPEALEQGRVRHSRLAIIVADTTIARSDQDRDARTVLASLMIERMKPGIYTCAELLNRDNEQHLRAAGIEEVVVTSEVGGHHLAMAAMHSGITEVLSELLTAKVGKTLQKIPVPEAYVGATYGEALQRLKAERDDLVIGLEVKGQDGPRTEGYAMLVNPEADVSLGARDNLIVVGSRKTKNDKD